MEKDNLIPNHKRIAYAFFPLEQVYLGDTVGHKGDVLAKLVCSDDRKTTKITLFPDRVRGEEGEASPNEKVGNLLQALSQVGIVPYSRENSGEKKLVFLLQNSAQNIDKLKEAHTLYLQTETKEAFLKFMNETSQQLAKRMWLPDAKRIVNAAAVMAINEFNHH